MIWMYVKYQNKAPIFLILTFLSPGQNQDIEAEASSGLDASILLNRVKRA